MGALSDRTVIFLPGSPHTLRLQQHHIGESQALSYWIWSLIKAEQDRLVWARSKVSALYRVIRHEGLVVRLEVKGRHDMPISQSDSEIQCSIFDNNSLYPFRECSEGGVMS
jgi:hypothetical protein